MESTLKNMVLVLGIITLVASGAVAGVYQLTKEPIEQAKAAKTGLAIGEVVPEFDNDITATAQAVEIDGGQAKIYTAEKGGQPVGYAVESFTSNGFSGLITLMVGFLPDGTINGIQVLSHAETPGLGSKMTEPGNALYASFEGKNPADLKMSVKKDGGDIDALTASTITSRAYVDAVQRAYNVFQSAVNGEALPEIEEVNPYELMFPGYDNDPAAEKKSFKNDIEPEIHVFPVRKGGELLGHMVYSATMGYSHDAPIQLLVGFAPDGTIIDIRVTGHAETPGFGAEITTENNPLVASIKGKKAGDLKLADVEAISGATITSEAYVKAVNAAAKAWEQVK
ncbi:RnfABCDGE type electron transport complex subunit G [Alistipes sp. OttesenSCG-928-L06]|nr:RnfABCDGE type electron transport complex subunit G [Alistipes sp. OttesenSCG-928-L06]